MDISIQLDISCYPLVSKPFMKIHAKNKRYMLSVHQEMGGGNLMYKELAKCVVIF